MWEKVYEDLPVKIQICGEEKITVNKTPIRKIFKYLRAATYVESVVNGKKTKVLDRGLTYMYEDVFKGNFTQL
jgi:hypothetical protein